MELRFIERDGKKILQQKVYADWPGTKETVWEDVPLVSGPPKSRRQEKRDELSKHIEKLTVQMMYGKGVVTNEQIAESALEWVEKQLPTIGEFHPIQTLELAGYKIAITDVRKNLGIDQ